MPETIGRTMPKQELMTMWQARKREQAVLVKYAQHDRAPRVFDWKPYEASGTAKARATADAVIAERWIADLLYLVSNACRG
jgi:hypothetical protein